MGQDRKLDPAHVSDKQTKYFFSTSACLFCIFGASRGLAEAFCAPIKVILTHNLNSSHALFDIFSLYYQLTFT